MIKSDFQRVLVLVLLTAALCVAFPRGVYAYLDPGAGSYVLQVILAGLFSALFTLRLFWSRIKAKLNKSSRTVDQSQQDQDAAQ